MSNEKIEAVKRGDFPDLGDEERELIEHFILEHAKGVSTDGGKTAKIKGAVIVIDQPTAQPKPKR